MIGDEEGIEPSRWSTVKQPTSPPTWLATAQQTSSSRPPPSRTGVAFAVHPHPVTLPNHSSISNNTTLQTVRGNPDLFEIVLHRLANSHELDKRHIRTRPPDSLLLSQTVP